MSPRLVAHDPSVAVRRRHLPSEAGEENRKVSAYEHAAPVALMLFLRSAIGVSAIPMSATLAEFTPPPVARSQR